MNGGRPTRQWRSSRLHPRRAARAACASAAVALAAIAIGCGSNSGLANIEPTGKATVVLGDGHYTPARVTIEAGERITFFNGSTTANTAETYGVGFFELDREDLARRGQFDVHTVQPGEAESVQLDRPGVYRYGSSLDGGMRGVIEVR